MEYETYADVIDAYNSGVGVEGGESLTDYIKRNNIKIKEIEMDPIGDFEKIFKGSLPMEKEGIESIELASASDGIDPNIRIQDVVIEFIKKYNRKPSSLDELKEFYFKEMTNVDGADSNKNNAQLAKYNPGDYDQDDIDLYENYKYNMNEQMPGMPIMDIDEFLRMEYGQAKAGAASGGLAGILGA